MSAVMASRVVAEKARLPGGIEGKNRETQSNLALNGIAA